MIVWAPTADDPAADPVDPTAGLERAETTSDSDPAEQRSKTATRRLVSEGGGEVRDSSSPSWP